VQKAWKWTRYHVSQVLSIVVSLLLAILGIGWLWRRKSSQIGAVKDQLAVTQATSEIVKLRALRADLKARVGDKDEAIGLVDEELKRNQRLVVEAHEQGDGLSDQEVADEFARLGY